MPDTSWRNKPLRPMPCLTAAALKETAHLGRILADTLRDSITPRLVALAIRLQGSSHAKIPYYGKNKPESQKQANRAHARLRTPASAQMPNSRPRIFKLRCCCAVPELATVSELVFSAILRLLVVLVDQAVDNLPARDPGSWHPPADRARAAEVVVRATGADPPHEVLRFSRGSWQSRQRQGERIGEKQAAAGRPRCLEDRRELRGCVTTIEVIEVTA